MYQITDPLLPFCTQAREVDRHTQHSHIAALGTAINHSPGHVQVQRRKRMQGRQQVIVPWDVGVEGLKYRLIISRVKDTLRLPK